MNDNQQFNNNIPNSFGSEEQTESNMSAIPQNQTFPNNTIPVMNVIPGNQTNNNFQSQTDPNIGKMINENNNQYINYDGNYNETSLNDLNVDGAYNNMDGYKYINDTQVRENLNGNKKNTITISKELKTVIIISLILLVFIFVVPNVFELINKIALN